MQYKDYYKILGVERSATPEEIKRAYKKLARKYHPDVSKERNAEERFKEVNEAHEVLKDPEKRAAYDQLGANWRAGEEFRPPPGWDHGFDFRGGPGGGGFHAEAGSFSDFFSSLFGEGSPFGGFGGFGDFEDVGRRRGPHGEMRGEDQHARMEITLEEAFHGATRQVSLGRTQRDRQGRVVTRPQTLKVRIPAGISAGQQIRLPGQGSPGAGGGPNGDLYLEVEIAPHPLFRLEQRDVYLELPITPWEAALGATVSVPTLGGRVEMKIQPGTQGGKKLRLKGRGLPGTPPGDQYLVVKIVTPPADTAAKRKIYEEMSRVMPFDPRRESGG